MDFSTILDTTLQYLSANWLELITGIGTSTTAIGVLYVRKMFVGQMTVQNIVLSEVAANSFAHKIQKLDNDLLVTELVDMYREVLRQLNSHTAPNIDQKIETEITLKIKKVTAIFERAYGEGFVGSDLHKHYLEFESIIFRLVRDLSRSNTRAKSKRHYQLVDEANEIIISLLKKLGDKKDDRESKIKNSNIGPSHNILFRYFGRFLNSENSENSVYF